MSDLSVSTLSARTPVRTQPLLSPKQRDSHRAAGSPPLPVSAARFSTSHNFEGSSLILTNTESGVKQRTPRKSTSFDNGRSQLVWSSMELTRDACSLDASARRPRSAAPSHFRTTPFGTSHGVSRASTNFDGGSMCLSPVMHYSKLRDTRMERSCISHMVGASMCVSSLGETAAQRASASHARDAGE